MESIEFTESEIQEELARLGYQNVPPEKLRDFKRDLHRLIEQEKSKDSSLNTCPSSAERTCRDRTALSGGFRDPVLRETVRAEERCIIDWEGRNGYDKYGKENHLTPRRDAVAAEMSLPKGLVYAGGQYSLYDTGEDVNQSNRGLQDDISECGSERRMVKRKVLRKTDKGSKFIDESMTESEAGSIADANECLQRLGLGDGQLELLRRPNSSKDYAPYRLSPNDPRPSSVILRPAEHPHFRNLRKADPVARHQQFQQAWQTQKAPGEKDHKDLRWNIRAQMLAQDTFEKKPQKVFVPNNYQVPTEKKRSNLRWQIRTDIAHGNMPPCGFFCEY